MVSTLLPLEGTRWTFQKQVAIPRDQQSLRVINQQLWQCHNEGVTVYDTDLCEQRRVPRGQMGQFYDVASGIPDGLFVAADAGLFHTTEHGDLLDTLDSNKHYSVAVYSGRLYAVRSYRNKCSVRVYEHQGSWQHQERNTIYCGEYDHKVSIAVSHNHIIVCSIEGKVDVYSHKQKFLYRLGTWGDKYKHWTVMEPFVCCNDMHDNVLIADRELERLQLVDSNRTFSIVDMDGRVIFPSSAVFYAGKLYVSEKRRLTLSCFYNKASNGDSKLK